MIIAADSLVLLAGKTYGKPKTKSEAKKLLKMLSGKIHEFVTGLCVIDLNTGKLYQRSTKTRVGFGKLTDKEINAYVERADVTAYAGAYTYELEGSKILRPEDENQQFKEQPGRPSPGKTPADLKKKNLTTLLNLIYFRIKVKKSLLLFFLLFIFLTLVSLKFIVFVLAAPTPTPNLYQCPNYWTNCKNTTSCPTGTTRDLQGQCGPGFICYLPVSTNPTPAPTAPSTTPTTAHQCPNYWNNCLRTTACPSGATRDMQGQCGPGFICCLSNSSPSPTASPLSSPNTSPAPTLLGDINGDGQVDDYDKHWLNDCYSPLTGIRSHLAREDCFKADLNTDGVVNALDYSLLLTHWGEHR